MTKPVSAKMQAYRDRRAAASKARYDQAHGPARPDPTVPLATYLKALDDVSTWRRRALDAEAHNFGSGDVLGEGVFRAGRGQGGRNDGPSSS